MRIILLLFLFFTVFPTPSIAAEDQFGVDYPFKTPLSRDNFKKCYPDVKDEDLNSLAKLRWYGYRSFGTPEVCPPAVGVDCKPGTKFFPTTRVMRFETDISASSFNRTLDSLQGGSCSYTRMKNRSFNVERNRISAHFQAFRQERVCAFGGNADVGEGSVDIDLQVTLNDDFSLSRGSSESNRRSSYLGFIDGDLLNNVGLNLVSLELGGFIPQLIKSVIHVTALSGISNDLNFGGAGIDLYRYSSVKPILDSIGKVKPQTEYVFDRQASGFSVDGSLVSIETFQTAYALELFRDTFIETRRTEVEFLRDLNEISPSEYVVVRGDTLWDIAGMKYRDPRLYLLVAHRNNLALGKKLVPGQVLSLPRWQELCEDLTGNPLAVRMGDSLWKKASRGEIPRNLSQVNTISGKRNLIYPFEVLSVNEPATPASGRALPPSAK